MLVDTVGRMARDGFTVTDRKVTHPVSSRARRAAPDPARAGLASTTRPGSTSSPAACTRPASRSSRPARPRRGSPAAGVPVTQVEELTGFPECLDGRVKTLHPRVHAGHPRRPRRDPTHVRAARPSSASSRSTWWSSNLYPFTRDRRRPARRPDECVEQIDIGGPSMVRAAAKNHPSVAVVTSPAAYADVLAARARRRLHPRAAPARWPPRRSCTPRRTTSPSRPGWATCSPTPPTAPASRRGPARPGTSAAVLRYGENPHQRGGALRRRWRRPGWPGRAAARQGDVLQQLRRRRRRPAGGATTSTEPAVAIIKHANPCGIAVGADVAEAHRKAHACDPVSAFGGVIATNRPVTVDDGRAGRRGLHRGRRRAGLTSDGAVEILSAQEEHPAAAAAARHDAPPTRSSSAAITGGLLMQTRDQVDADAAATTRRRWTLATGDAGRRRRRSPTSRSPGGPAAR